MNQEKVEVKQQPWRDWKNITRGSLLKAVAPYSGSLFEVKARGVRRLRGGGERDREESKSFSICQVMAIKIGNAGQTRRRSPPTKI